MVGKMRTLEKNVFGDELKSCCEDPLTGYYRDGFCTTGEGDFGKHITCAEMTEEFLNFSLSMGNDLITPRPEYEFKGLKPGDRWCLCVSRWVEAYKEGVAPKVKLEATHEKMLKYIDLKDLKNFALKI